MAPEQQPGQRASQRAGQAAGRGRGPQHPMRRRLVMGFLGAVAAGGIVFAFSAPTRTDTTGLPAEIESVSPPGGDLDLRQVTIAADLAAGWTGYLLLDGTEVPLDDLTIVDALNSVTLTPTEISDYRELSPGRHCAAVVYRPQGTPRASTDKTHTWCFRLH